MAYINFKELREINAFEYLTKYENFSVHTSKTNKSWLDGINLRGVAIVTNNNNGEKFLIRKDARFSSEFRIGALDGSALPMGKSFSKYVDLVSFISHLHHCDFKEAANKIVSASDSMMHSFNSVPKIQKYIPSQSELSQKLFSSLMPFDNDSYFIGRHIPPRIAKEPIFKNRIQSFPYGSHKNVCFNMFSKNDEFITTCVRYFSGEKTVKLFPSVSINGEKYSPSTNHSLFLSNIPPNPKFLLFSESPEDALSYYTLHHKELKNKTIFCSSLGNFRSDQALMIQSLSSQYGIDKFILINDNDAPGLKYDLLAVANFLSASGTHPLFSSAALYSNNTDNTNTLSLQYSKEHFSFIAKFVHNLHQFLGNDEVNFSQNDCSFSITYKNNFSSNENVLFALQKADDSSFLSSHFLFDKTPDYKFSSDKHKVACKDWNEYLKHFSTEFSNEPKKIEQVFKPSKIFEDFFLNSDIELNKVEKKKKLKTDF